MTEEIKNIEIDYKLMVAVWEITMNCNMRCKHCGSSCEGPMPDELTTEEALNVCDQLGEMGLKRITLSGGEPFTRKDWPLLVQRLAGHGILTNILSNGWLLDRETILKAREAGAVNLGMSLDGLEETHDYIRRKGSFRNIMNALDIMKEVGMPGGIVTCIHRKNIHELPGMKKLLTEKGVEDWQLQAAIPMGNMLQHQDWLLDQAGVDEIIDVAYEFMKDGDIRIDLADDIGYFNRKEIEIRKSVSNDPANTGIWSGCPAGKAVIGIRTNGDIIGCLSIRDDEFIEGNIRETSLHELWTRPGAFAWNRELTKEKLTGFCGKCQYANYCLGGCAGTKLIRFNTISHNEFCSFRCAVMEEKDTVDNIDDIKQLIRVGQEKSNDGEFQAAEMYIAKALEQAPEDVELLNLLGFINYNLENFSRCEALNRKSLEVAPDNVYALKGLGVCLATVGQLDDGIELLRRAIARTDENFMDPYFDLAVILAETERKDEAIEVLEQGRQRSEVFKQESQEIYDYLNK